MSGVVYRIEPEVSDGSLNALFTLAWENRSEGEFGPILRRSLTYICAFDGSDLIAFVNVAWDGGIHGFILDTTVHPDYQRRGIGTELMRQAATTAAERGIEWLHADFEPHLLPFYRACGYRNTEAGLLNLSRREVD